jgi:hypothetical protein
MKVGLNPRPVPKMPIPANLSSSKNALEVVADLVRQIFRYFEFELRVGGIQLRDAG